MRPSIIFTLFLTTLRFVLPGEVNAQKNIVYDSNAEVRTVGDFKAVEISGAITVYLSKGEKNAVAIGADDAKYIGKIITKVDDGVLKIYVEAGSWNTWNWSNVRIRAYVTITTLEKLKASGAATIKTTSDITVSELAIDISGASTFKGGISGKNIAIKLSGASGINFTGGNVENMNATVNGASGLNAYDLTADMCNINVSGASAAHINASKEISIKVSGASSLNYKGDAAIKNIDVSGASSAKKKD